MATVIYIKESKQTPSAMRGCINYCAQEKKTVDENGRQYVGGVNCLGTHAYDEFMATKNLYGKTSGTYFYQYVQSFMPGEIKSYDEAHRIGLEFAEKSFPGYEVLVATHLDAYDDNGVQRVHNHFIVNSVGFEDGKKIKSPKKSVSTCFRNTRTKRNLSLKRSPHWSRKRRPSVMMRQMPTNSSAV